MTGSSPGICVWLTGRSGAGKTTVTSALVPMLQQAGRTVTVLDTVPQLAKAPGERTSEGKLMRKAYVASEIVRHGGVAICVTVSARRDVRERARQLVGSASFVEVHFDVPVVVAGDRRNQRGSRRSLSKRVKHVLRPMAKAVSARYRGGYEPPEAADVTIDAVQQSPDEAARSILDRLRARELVT